MEQEKPKMKQTTLVEVEVKQTMDLQPGAYNVIYNNVVRRAMMSKFTGKEEMRLIHYFTLKQGDSGINLSYITSCQATPTNKLGKLLAALGVNTKKTGKVNLDSLVGKEARVLIGKDQKNFWRINEFVA